MGAERAVGTHEASGPPEALDSMVVRISSDAASTLVLTGELDATTAPLIRAAVSASKVNRRAPIKLVDARELTFISAAGLTALLELADGEPLSVMMSACVQRLVQLCGVSGRLHRVADEGRRSNVA